MKVSYYQELHEYKMLVDMYSFLKSWILIITETTLKWGWVTEDSGLDLLFHHNSTSVNN
jgi:hypothetical protein